MGLTRAHAAAVVALAWVALVGACFDPPQPACGFACGPGSACPAKYTCGGADHRCHLDGTFDACEPAPVMPDAAPDGAPPPAP